MRKNLQLLSFIILLFFAGNAWGQVTFYVLEPPSLEGTYDFTYPAAGSGWGFDLDNMAPIVDTLALVDDGTTGDSLGCNSLVNAAAIQGKIALIYRGDCQFGVKALNAQAAGAVAVIIVNNITGPPVGMGAGTSGSAVTIPTIMVSDVTGALLRAAMATGPVVAFIGNRSGYFANDVGTTVEDVILPRAMAIHVDATEDSAYAIPVGAFVNNVGNAAQSGVTLNATVTLNGNTLYNQTGSAPTSILPGDSVFIALPTFNQSPYDTGVYTLTYTIASASTDEFPDDNVLALDFWVNDQYWSKARMNPSTGEPIGSTYALRAAAPAISFQWCSAMNERTYGGLSATSLQFALSTNDPAVLTNKSVQVELYEWLNERDTITVDSLIELSTNVYEYPSHLEYEFIDVPFSTNAGGVPLEDGKKYLACLHIFNDSVFIVTDRELNYYASLYFGYGEYMFPVNVNSWNAVGFGAEDVPALAVSLQKTGIGIAEKEEGREVKAYPNPATEYVAIPISADKAGKYNVRVVDVSGKLVHKGSYNVTNNQLRINTADITNGVYYFSITGDDNKTRTFSVVISK